MISIILIFLAGIANAIMDTTQFHFEQSIFRKLNKQWWNGNYSWRNKYISGNSNYGRRKILNRLLNYPVTFTDAFHLFKSLMAVFICFSIVFYSTISGRFITFEHSIYNILIDFVILRSFFGLGFVMFFDWILRKR